MNSTPLPAPAPLRTRHLHPVKAARAVVVLLLLVLALVAPTSPASAYEQSGRYSPGRVTPYQVQGTHYNACAGTTITCYNPYVSVPGPTVTRSPATRRAQDVRVGYQLLGWNGSSWYQVKWGHRSARIGRGQYQVNFAGLGFDQIRAGYYKVNLAVQWYRAGTTRMLGERTIFYSGNDYGCVGRFTAYCSTGAGWVYLRSPM